MGLILTTIGVLFEKNEKKRGERGARRSECDFVGLILATIGLLGGQSMTLWA